MFALLMLSSLGTGTAGPQDFPASFGYGDGGYSGYSGYTGYGGYGGYSTYGSSGWWGGGYGYAPSSYAPAAAQAGAPESVPPSKQATAGPARAKLIVEVPADARLYIGDKLMKTGSSHRVFRTPELEAGQTYHYIVRAEVTRDGKKVEQTKRVIVRPGEEATASFTDLDVVPTARTDK
jgi:uncharacterized protein (TIGR03000 family)